MPKKLRDIGEFEFIKRINRMSRVGASVVKGIGDDCAVLKYTRDKYLLFTTDMIIEGVHFKKTLAQPEEIGHKALAVNISDIAACGGTPKWAVVSAGFPSSCEYNYICRIHKGVRGLARSFKIDIVGGDTNASEKILISVALIGEVEKPQLILRSGAEKRDIIFLTGPLCEKPDDLTFTPRLEEARLLVKNFNLNSMIDISDGFLSDLSNILQESSKGAVIYESLIPYKVGLPRERNVPPILSLDRRGFPTPLAMMKVNNRGEQFELIFTLSRSESKRLPKCFYPVGEIVDAGKGIIYVTRDGKRKKVAPRGYRHF